MSKKAEELREQLEAARAELNDLLTEQGRLGQDLRRAEQEDHEERLRAARSGGSIAATLSKMKSKVRGVKDRREEVPYEIWTARIRVAELERAHYEAIAPELEKKMQGARAASYAAEQEMREAEARHKELSDVYGRAFREQDEAYQRSLEVERELTSLEADGPEPPAA